MELSELLLRIGLSFFVLLGLTRVMGRKELSQLTFFNFVSGIAIGSIAANLVVSQNLSIRNGIIALAGWSALTIVMGLIDIKSKKARKFIEGEPLILIKNGQIMESALRKARLDIDALNAILREKNAFSIADVDYAIFETDGKLSVMKKHNKQSVKRSDMLLQKVADDVYPMPTEVISDGTVNQKNLEDLNLDKKWIDKQLEDVGIKDVGDVFYAELQKDGSLYIDKKNDVIH
ncbi:DUF421 domain-containing protein [Aquibacillus koreensis]|uniref:DUF421 domain-containing protein n=1 Tax=Aquibacillus koreensis TaxID=279446 RepID=A0A9X3WKB2_9BACI|nr:DUF421 domain-containing protein [Aquibacillus koreensis]MCT2535742.1 DUF421 domain-containing protein [Aquibacillus koreensis]MDC3420198.1 DUF421 domain-containing protein [Aquibacillus koreensis]